MSEKSIATLKIIDEATGAVIPVNVRTCAEAVTCPDDRPLPEHLAVLDGHAQNEGIHLTIEEKAGLETQEGAQKKATAAKNEAVATASLLVENAKTVAAEDATKKAASARNAAYKHTDGVSNSLQAHANNTGNPHNVTAAQVGLGNVVNKSPNDLQPTYTAASALTELSSGEKLSVAFGKIKKAISDVIAHIANNSNPHGVTFNQVILKKTYVTETNENGNANTSVDCNNYVVLNVSATDESGNQNYICHLYKSDTGRWFVNICNVTSKANVARKKFTLTIYYAAK